MSWHTRFKFKERIIIGIVAVFFTSCIILEQTILKYYAVKPAIKSFPDIQDNTQDIHAYQNIQGQVANNDHQNSNVLDALESPVLTEGEILKEILQEVGGHLSFIRKKLSISGEYADSSDQQNSQVVQHLLSNSSIIKKYPEVFIKISELLEGETREQHIDSRDSGHKAKQVDSHGTQDIDATHDEENVEIHYVYGSVHPKRVYTGNITISHLAKPKGYWKEPGVDFELSSDTVNKIKDAVRYISAKQRPKNINKRTLNVYKDDGDLKPHQKWHNSISQLELYSEHSAFPNEVVRQLHLSPITSVQQRKDEGTQLKLFITHEDGLRSIFKPMRFLREQDTIPDQYYFSDYERHTAEIAAFHLDRLLGFRRAPPVAGRVVHMLNDLKEHARDPRMEKEFFVSPSGNVCYRGDERCLYCENRHPVCARGSDPHLLEGAFIASYPNEVARQEWEYPWKRSYVVREAAEWEHNSRYCLKVRAKKLYRSGRRLLDIMDLAVFDFLMGNMDRHHYETFTAFGNDTFILHLDNGKGFGNPYEDEMTCLAPLTQCCMIRHSTLSTLLSFHTGPIHLSNAMRRSLSNDHVAPVLMERHFRALDRRVKIVLRTVAECIEKRSRDSVVIDDGLSQNE